MWSWISRRSRRGRSPEALRPTGWVSSASMTSMPWLFHFRAANIEPVLEVVRATRGVAIGPTVLANGDRVAVCEDPQGAAFALHGR